MATNKLDSLLLRFAKSIDGENASTYLENFGFFDKLPKASTKQVRFLVHTFTYKAVCLSKSPSEYPKLHAISVEFSKWVSFVARNNLFAEVKNLVDFQHSLANSLKNAATALDKVNTDHAASLKRVAVDVLNTKNIKLTDEKPECTQLYYNLLSTSAPAGKCSKENCSPSDDKLATETFDTYLPMAGVKLVVVPYLQCLWKAWRSEMKVLLHYPLSC